MAGKKKNSTQTKAAPSNTELLKEIESLKQENQELENQLLDLHGQKLMANAQKKQDNRPLLEKLLTSIGDNVGKTNNLLNRLDSSLMRIAGKGLSPLRVGDIKGLSIVNGLEEIITVLSLNNELLEEAVEIVEELG